MKRPFTAANQSQIVELQGFLQSHQYFSQDCLPGVADATLFQIFQKEVPQRKLYPALTAWYVMIKQFAHNSIKQWKIKSENDDYFSQILDSYNNFISKGSNPETQLDPSTQLSNSEQEFLLNVRFKLNVHDALNNLIRKLQTEKVQIITYESTSDEIKLIFRSQQPRIEVIKNLISCWEEVSTHEIKRFKHKKISKMRAFPQEKC